jgi:hypothetical protein
MRQFIPESANSVTLSHGCAFLDCRLHFANMEVFPAMETVLDPQAPAASTAHRSTSEACETDWTVAMSIDVDADARRIFHALTVPEYLETWIDLPDRGKNSAIVAAATDNGYRLDHYSDGRVDMSISGSYLFCHQRKLRLFWRESRLPKRTDSLVDFRLRGNFGSSVLELRHRALRSAEEYFWHERLWRGSLEKLTSLLRSA